MKIIFMGTPDFSVPSLKTIFSEEYELIGVVTQPDRPRGRGKRLLPSPVKKWALEKGINIYQPLRARDEEFITQIEDLAPDLIVTAAYGQILPKKFWTFRLLAVSMYMLPFTEISGCFTYTTSHSGWRNQNGNNYYVYG